MSGDAQSPSLIRRTVRNFLAVFGPALAFFFVGGILMGGRWWLDPHIGGWGTLLVIPVAIIGATIRVAGLLAGKRANLWKRWLELGIGALVFCAMLPIIAELILWINP